MSEENNLTECMCDFCGQVLQADEETMRRAGQDPRLAAKLICDCKEAKEFEYHHTIIERGSAMVDNICGKGSGKPLEADLVHILHSAVSRITKRQMVGVTLNVSAKEKVELKMGSKGIKCNRTVKETEVDECRF